MLLYSLLGFRSCFGLYRFNCYCKLSNCQRSNLPLSVAIINAVGSTRYLMVTAALDGDSHTHTATSRSKTRCQTLTIHPSNTPQWSHCCHISWAEVVDAKYDSIMYDFMAQMVRSSRANLLIIDLANFVQIGFDIYTINFEHLKSMTFWL